ncbi:Uncharacterized protein FWK35_00036643, partial [Aphis craccivora]
MFISNLYEIICQICENLQDINKNNSSKRGRPAAVPIEEQLAIFITHESLLFQDQNNLKKLSDSVWKKLEKLLDGKFTAATLYFNLLQNRGNLMDKLVENNGRVKKTVETIESFTDDENNMLETYISDVSENEIDSSGKNIEFAVKLKYDDYRKLKPEERNYKRGKYVKSFTTLKPHYWTSLFYERIWSKTKLPCNYVFKKCVIGSENTKHYFTFIGQCKDCLSKISGWSDDKPFEDDEIWRINICAEPPKISKLLHTSKRQCKGVEREEVSKLLLHNVPSNWQREKVDKICNFGDKIPPHVYGNHVLRQAKNEFKSKILGITEKCPISSLDILKQTSQNGSIHTICFNELFVHYWSPFQIAVYKSANKLGHTKLAIDGTGSLVQKIKRVHSISHHIFLYEIVLYGYRVQ